LNFEFKSGYAALENFLTFVFKKTETMNLSVGIITYNEERDLPVTLQAVRDIADEIVIVDSGSTDKTLDIARSFNARVFVEAWKGFGEQKNAVIEKCRGQWILLIDADEEITGALKEKIREIISAPPAYDIYKIRFTTTCFGKKIRHGGWSGFYRIRLFRKGAGRYDGKKVHETFLPLHPVGRLKEAINHYTYSSLEEYFGKFNAYTSQLAAQYREKGKHKPPLAVYCGALWVFFKAYIWQLGFLDGFEGYLLAKCGTLYFIIKYAKLRELRKAQGRAAVK
jgi:glycosyltransferase involved in cell wall biosynthesis